MLTHSDIQVENHSWSVCGRVAHIVSSILRLSRYLTVPSRFPNTPRPNSFTSAGRLPAGGGRLGYDLARWAQRENHPCLTARTRQVLVAICMVAHDEHGEFWMRPQRFLDEHLPGMTYGAYRNHLSTLVQNKMLIKIEQGGGRTSHGRGKTTRYRVNSPAVVNAQPEQSVLPDIARSPEAPPMLPEVEQEQGSDIAKVHDRVDEILASGVTPGQVLAILEFVSDTLNNSRNLSDSPQRKLEINPNQSRILTGSRHPSRNLSEKLTGIGIDTQNLSENDHLRPQSAPNLSENLTGFNYPPDDRDEKPVRFSGIHKGNPSDFVTDTHYMEDKSNKEKENHAAAATQSNSSGEMTSFFELLSATLLASGHRGIRATQFADLSGLIQDYEAVTGSSPNQHTADYIVGRLRDSKGVRNVVGFVRTLTEDVLRTGEGYVAVEEAPPSATHPPPRPPEEPDWELLHMAHIRQESSARDVWAQALEALRSQVSRPAVETWLSDSCGVAHTEGQFIVGTRNRFTAEMLGHRLHPVIERAVRDVVGAELEIQYAVEAQAGERCPVCDASTLASAAAS